MKLVTFLIALGIAVAVVSAALSAPAWMGAVAGAILVLAYVRFGYLVAKVL